MPKTRYLQMTDVMMFEYRMLGSPEGGTAGQEIFTDLSCVELRDGHRLLVAPASAECEKWTSDTSTGYKLKREPLTVATINHMCVPEDQQGSVMYRFMDPEYEYVDDGLLAGFPETNQKVKEYSKWVTSPDGSANAFAVEYTGISGLRRDTARLYFVNGYDFSDIWGVQLKIYVEQDRGEGEKGQLDLCSIVINADDAFSMMKYLPSPIFFGNDIYDRYVEIGLPCVYDLSYGKDADGHHEIFDSLGVVPDAPIRLVYSEIIDENVTLEGIESTVAQSIAGDVYEGKVNASYMCGMSVRGAIPVENTVSDNLGCYVAEVPGLPYIEFYATWKDEPLTKDIVWQFNKGIRLYDKSLMKPRTEYEIDDDYRVEHSERKWMAMHEIRCTFCMGDKVIKEETYSMNQTFVSDTDQTRFMYRPFIFDSTAGLYIDNIQIVYTMRFVNTDDRVQFLKMASLSLTGNMGRFYAMSSSLTRGDMSPYRVYNRISENRSAVMAKEAGPQKVKYVKMFYNSTDISLDVNGDTVASNSYVMEVGIAPKSYKFTFKKTGVDGKYTFMDLSDGYYKLMFRDKSGDTVLIEPTYSTNMNMYLGELEFNISSQNINKMRGVSEEDRKAAIISYGEDGSASSMYEFSYSV